MINTALDPSKKGKSVFGGSGRGKIREISEKRSRAMTPIRSPRGGESENKAFGPINPGESSGTAGSQYHK
jgi:hypothetical protein